MASKVMVSGAAGFVGSAVVEALLGRGYEVNALHRPGDNTARQSEDRLTIVRGDLFDAPSLGRALDGCDAVIHLVGIIMEKPGATFARVHVDGTRAMIEAAARSGIARYLHMSALGARADAVSDYHKTKWQAEELVRSSGLDFTIFRPSMIHGPRGEFVRQAAAWARGKAMPFLFMPYFGSGLLGFGGAGLIQPVHVADVARAFVDALEKSQTIGHAYEIGGPDRMTWPQMYDTIADAVVGKRRLKVAIPAWYARLLTRVAPASALPFNRDQVTMSQEDNVADLRPFIDAFGWTPAAFGPLIRGYAGEL